MTRTSDKLALLVGSNPLPNYLAAMALGPNEVVLLYTPETEKPRDCLSEVLSTKGIRVTSLCIRDATDARCIRDAFNERAFLDCDHLHYSGGTKPMAAHARMAFAKDDKRVSYLDERKGILRFEDCYDEPLSNRDLGLSLDVLHKLHGVERVPEGGGLKPEPTDSDADIIAKRVLASDREGEALLKQLNDLEERLAIAKANPFDGRTLGLSQPVIPAEEWNQRVYKRWRAFLRGGWLERWSSSIIRKCLDPSPSEISVNVKGKRDGVEFEVDVAIVRCNRLYVVSCTTDGTLKLCKSKLFEIAMRSRQMGGDLARCALFCLLDGSDSKGAYVEQLRTDIRSLWEAQNVPQVFGLVDLREWIGVNGLPNTETMTKWLSE